MRRLAVDLGLALLLAAGGCIASTWPDTVRVGRTRYPVPELWRGLRMGPSDAAPPADLLPIPDSLCASGRTLSLRRPALEAFLAMCGAARRAGVSFSVNSAYRNIQAQRDLIEKRLEAGRDFESVSWSVAPPGYSEHMLGTTVDLDLGPKRGTGSAYAWLKRHAGEFGFVESYPNDSTQRFPYEPWHWRWRGPLLAPGPVSGGDARGR